MESGNATQIPQEYVNQVWLGLFDVERLHRYYGRLAVRYKTRDQILTFAIILGSSAAAVTLLAHLWTWISIVLGFTVASIAIWSIIAKYGEKAAIARMIAMQCGEEAGHWKRLWLELSQMGPAETIERLRELESRMGTMTANGIGMMDEKLNEKCAREADRANWAEFGDGKERAVPAASA